MMHRCRFYRKPRSRPTSRNSDTFGYNERGEVVAAQIGSSHFSHGYDYIGNQTNHVVNAATNTYTHNYLNQIETASFSILNSPFSISHDLDGNGITVVQYAYDAFGKMISQSGALADVFRHRFSTKYFDPETCLYYCGYRFYSPSLMRWLNRDPIEEDGGLNLYGFCGNNPINRLDVDGRKVQVTQSDKEITVTLNITIYYANRIELNARTDLARIARRIKKQIEDKWNAQKWRYGCCTVKFVANVKYKNQVGSDGLADDNLIAITTDAKHRSYSVGKGKGYWTVDNIPGSDWRYAHEAGHLMGLDDDYNEQTGLPNPGHEDHMMGRWGKPVAQHEVEDLLRANNVRCN